MQGVQFLAGFETDGFAWGNAHFSAGAGIAPDAGLTGTDAEDAESAQLNAVAGGQRLLEAFEYRVDRRFRLGARQSGALDDVMHDILLDQCRRPFG